jgi:hypothetical protein
MAYNTLANTYGYKLATSDTLLRLQPKVLRAMRLPSTGSEQAASEEPGWNWNRWTPPLSSIPSCCS